MPPLKPQTFRQVRFKVTDDFFIELREAIELRDGTFVTERFKELYPADIAEIFNELDIEEAKFVYSHLDEQIAADVLVELDEDVREEFLSSLTSKEIAERFIDNMDSDDAADVIAELPDNVQDEVLSHMEDSEQASDIVELLNYDENTAGGLMATELIRVHVNSNALECVREIRAQADEVENIYTIYVVDDDEKLVGLLSLKKLIISPTRSKVADICDTKIISVKTNTDAEDVANIMDKYNLVVLPVVDSLGRLVGRITIDDIVDIRREEETEDLQRMAGMEALEEPYMNISIWGMLKKRAGWLIILFIGETFTATAMGFFEHELAKAVVLALFVPLIISSGGNTGSQASTLVIRALALGEITVRHWWDIIRREFKVGLMLGLILGVIGFLRVAVWSQFTPIYGPNWMEIALTVGFSLIGVVVWGNTIGSLFPLLLKRLGLDPAVSSAPFVATLVDITGLIIYFSVASLLLGSMLV
ncbi:MAG: magnesium transporter [Bacteroidota bacterium]|nr:magnesium transporter [Bacteroidota bacterium]